MPKTTSFNANFGYVRHPDDVDGSCFWCDAPCVNTWDYTPPRVIAQHPELVAKLTEPLYAVSACKLCINKITYRKSMLNTIAKKLLYFSINAEKKKAAVEKLQDTINMDWHPWQCRLENGSYADLPDYVLDDFQRAAKNAYFSSKTEPDQEDSSESGDDSMSQDDNFLGI